MQLLYDCFVGASAQRGRGRTRTTSLHRVAKACCHPEPRVPLGKLRRSVDSSDQAFARASCHEEAKRSDLSRWLTEASCKQAAPETNRYFYHPDHLGSSSFITDATGYAVQHLQYLPFGETFVDQTPATNPYDSRYTFSAKEKDDETQYSYFGARYYDSDLSVWLSVDPMADKYPNLSPYAYCANNPVMLVDPDGRAPGDPPFSVYYYYSLTRGSTDIVQLNIFQQVISEVKPLIELLLLKLLAFCPIQLSF